jgi:hypothetical protein
VNWADKPVIVYVAMRKNAEAIMHALKDEGVSALLPRRSEGGEPEAGSRSIRGKRFRCHRSEPTLSAWA